MYQVSHIETPSNLFQPGYENSYEYIQPESLPEKNKSAQVEKKKNGERLERYQGARKRLPEEIRQQEYDFYSARYNELLKDTTLTADEAAETYWNWTTEHSQGGWQYPRDAMKCSANKREKKTLESLEKSMGYLLGMVDSANRYNLHASHLDLNPACENPELFFDKENIALWREGIERYVPLPYYCKLQVGWHFGENRIHPHIIASKPEGKLASIKSERVIKEITNPEGFVDYIQNLGLPWNLKNLKIRISGERERNVRRLETGKKVQLPRTSWYSKGLPNSRTWNKAK